MSVNEVSGNSGAQGNNTYDEYWAQYTEKYNQFTSLINDDRYKIYFGQGAELDDLQKLLSEKLEALKTAIEGLYDESVIDELMQALGVLLSGSASNMGLEARIAAYIALLDAKSSITSEDYQMLLNKLNSPEGITQTVFNQLLNVAKSYKSDQIIEADRDALFTKIISGIAQDRLENLLDLAKKRKQTLDDLNTYKIGFEVDDYYDRLQKLNDYSLENASLDSLIDATEGIINETIKKDPAIMATIEIKNQTDSVCTQSQAIQKTLAGVVFANEVKAYNSSIEFDRQMKDENNRSNDVNFNRLQDENVLNEQRESIQKNRQEIQHQEALQAAKNAARIEAERRAKNENV